jgi:PhnB protein
MKRTTKPAKKTIKKLVRKVTVKKAVKKSGKKAATKRVQAVPKGYTAVTASLVCKDAGAAMDFYAKAFGAKDRGRLTTSNGIVVHGELRIGDAVIMLGEEMPEMGAHSPLTIGGSPVTLMLYVKDVDAAYARATAAGCTTLMPPANMFWGDRYCRVADPFGHQWAIATHIEDMSIKEMGRRMIAEFGQ